MTCLRRGKGSDFVGFNALRLEGRLRRFDGEYRWYLFRFCPLRDETGNIVNWYGTNTDIEDRKRADAALKRSEAFLAEGQHLSRTGSFSWHLATDEITWSEELYRIFEFDPGVPVTLELIGTRVHAEDIPLVDDMIDRARGAGSDFEFEHQLQMLDHSVKYLHMVAHGTRDQDGQLEYTGAVQDVTQRRSSEEALGKARSELAHVARVTSLGVLTASIAHEVNQPLSGIITNASTCLRMLAADPPNVDCCNIPWVLKNSFKGISPTKSRSQAIECSFAVDAEMHGSYCFGSFFNSHSPLH